MSTIYATFRDAEAAERAAGALLDHGADRSSISIISNENSPSSFRRTTHNDTDHAEDAAKEGFSTTTPADVAVGAAKGAGVGAGVGILAALAALFIPGVGWVIGTGALATALAGAAATTAAGVAAGGIVGYLKDQGVSEEYVTKYSSALYDGGAILALEEPSGTLATADAEGILAKYGAINVGTFYAQQPEQIIAPVVDTVHTTPTSVPVVMPSNTNPTVIRTTETEQNVPTTPELAQETRINSNQLVVTPTGQVVTPGGTVEGTTVPSPTGPQVVVAQSQPTADPLAPSTTVVVDPNTGVRRSITEDPVSGLQTSAVVDPVTGEAMPSTVMTVQSQGINASEHQSVTGEVPGVPVVDAPGIDQPTVLNTPVVKKEVAVDASGNPIGEVDILEDQTAVVDPNKAKLL